MVSNISVASDTAGATVTAISTFVQNKINEIDLPSQTNLVTQITAPGNDRNGATTKAIVDYVKANKTKLVSNISEANDISGATVTAISTFVQNKINEIDLPEFNSNIYSVNDFSTINV